MTAYRVHTKKDENPQKIEYKIPLETDNMSDILAEKFDNLMSFMPKNSYLFSGAIATYFANQDLARYVCMILDKNNYEIVRRDMSRSIYWLNCNNCNIENVFETGIVCNNIKMNAKAIFTNKVTEMAKSVNFDDNVYKSENSKWGSDPFGTRVIRTSSKRNAFINTQGAIVILICGDINTIRNSGISINGVVVDHEGQVYEVIHGAKEACERKILRKSRINRNTDGMFIKNINNSLVNSGWKSTVNVDGMCNAIEAMNKPKPTRTKTNNYT